MPRKGQRLKKDSEVIRALQLAWGNVTEAAKILGYEFPESLWNRIARKPALIDAKNRAKKFGIDVAVNGLMQFINKQDLSDPNNPKPDYSKERLDAIKFYLSRMGRLEGWGESKDINVTTETAQYDFDKLPIDERKKILDIFEKARVIDGSETGS